jgi:hypothetical protein
MVYLTTGQRATDQVPAEEKLPVKVKVPVDTPGPMKEGEMGAEPGVLPPQIPNHQINLRFPSRSR